MSVLWLGCQGNKESLNLLSPLPVPADGVVLGPSEPLASQASTPFLGGPWKEPKGGVRPARMGRPYVRFYLSQRLPLSLQVKGAGLARPLEMEVFINGHSLGPLELTAEMEESSFVLDPDWLLEGENRVYLVASEGTLWSSLAVRPRFLPKSFQGGSVGVTRRVRDDSVLLPHSSSLDIPLAHHGSGRTIIVSGSQPWLEEGADPNLESLVNLRVRSEHPPFDQSWSASPGLGIEATIPDELENMTVSLTSLPQEIPMPGQLGVKLKSVRLEYQPTAKVTPSVVPEISRQRAPLVRPPNVVLYVIDTLRADHLGCYGYERKTSPNIDALSRDGVCFEEVTAQSSWTKSSVATILTGLLPSVHGALDYADKLPQEVETVAEILAQNGYSTVAVVGNGFASGRFEVTQGFQKERLILGRAHQIHDTVVTSLEQLDPSKPFFLHVHTMDPHTPYAPPKVFNRWSKSLRSVTGPQLREIGERAWFGPASGTPERPPELEDLIALDDGEVAANDHAFGLLVKELKERGLYDNTLILVVSDHGEEFFEHGGFGHVHTLYRELLRVPLVVKFPNQVGAGTRAAGEWQHLDVAPTMLAALGIEVPPAMKGIAFDPSAPQTPKGRALHSLTRVGPDAVEAGLSEQPFLTHLESVQVSHDSYIECYSQGRARSQARSLFSLDKDPGQTVNLRFQEFTRANQLQQLLLGNRASSDVEPANAPADVTREFLEGLQYLR